MFIFEFYDFLIKKRGIKKAVQYETPILKHPTVADRIELKTAAHIWKYGDRFYNLASKYYGDVTYWWVIAWYNIAPTEAHLKTGDIIEIPVDIEQALKVIGA